MQVIVNHDWFLCSKVTAAGMDKGKKPTDSVTEAGRGGSNPLP